MEAAIRLSPALDDQALDTRLADAGHRLPGEGGGRLLRVIGVALRGLEQCQAQLEAVIGGERPSEQLGQQQLTLAKLIDDPGLGHHDVFRKQE